MRYPQRPKLYAHHYIEWMIQSGVTREADPAVFSLLVAVAHAEDRTFYRRPPAFYNRQIADDSAIGSEPALIRARNRAVQLGLLHYEPGAKRRPGRYFTLGFPNESLVKAEGKRGFPNESLVKAEGKRKESDVFPNESLVKAKTTYPTPNNPISRECAAGGESRSKGKTGTGYPEDFSRFWEAFPSVRRTGKRAALKAWHDAIKRTDPETLIAAAKRYAASPVGQGEYCKGPTPWLNQGCWEDAPEAWGVRNGSPANGSPATDLRAMAEQRRRNRKEGSK